jgi:hypothetical protein
LPKLNAAYVKLIKDGPQKRLAEVVAECVGLLFPLYYPRVIEDAQRQLKNPGCAQLEGLVYSTEGAEMLMAALDGDSPRFRLSSGEVHGQYAIPIELPPLARPDVNEHVLHILAHIVQATNASMDDITIPKRDQRPEVRMQRLADDLNGYLTVHQATYRRGLYGVVSRLGPSNERKFRSMVFRKIRDLVPRFVFIELDPAASTREIESMLRACVLLGNQEGRAA